MAHKYICDECHKEKTCAMVGCRGDCVKLCVTCVRGTFNKEHAKRWKERQAQELFHISAVRRDGSSKTSGPMVGTYVSHVVSALLALDADVRPTRIVILSYDPKVELTDNGPILPLSQAMTWRQPDDDISRILR